MSVDFQKNYLKKNNIDFNFIADLVSKNNLENLSKCKDKLNALDSIFQIKQAQKDHRLFTIFNRLNNDFNPTNRESDISIFFSMMSGSSGAQHVDEESVHIIGLYGMTAYLIEDKVFTINPGDRLFISKGIPHKAVSLSPRIVLSYGIY